MSWKEVFRELSDMEGIVQRMEEEEVEQEDMVEVVREDQEKPDLKSKLMREIMDFNKKTQLRNVNEGEVQSEDDANDGVETINISPEEPRNGAHTQWSKFTQPPRCLNSREHKVAWNTEQEMI